MNNFTKRSLTGALYVGVLLGGVLIHPLLFLLVFGSILFLTLSEFYKLSESGGFQPQKKLGVALGIILFILLFLSAGAYIPSGYILFILPIILLALIGQLFNKKAEPLKNSLVVIGGLIYVALPFGLMSFVIFSDINGEKTFHPWILAGTFFILWVYDSMAYVTGTLIGKHKIAPHISAKKSWEGLIGGSLFAVIMGTVNAVLFQAIDLVSWIVLALLVVVFGTFGDFFESRLKRDLDIKDSGSILPGHGGLLDRFDSLLFAIPMVFLWLSMAQLIL